MKNEIFLCISYQFLVLLNLRYLRHKDYGTTGWGHDSHACVKTRITSFQTSRGISSCSYGIIWDWLWFRLRHDGF